MLVRLQLGLLKKKEFFENLTLFNKNVLRTLAKMSYICLVQLNERKIEIMLGRVSGTEPQRRWLKTITANTDTKASGDIQFDSDTRGLTNLLTIFNKKDFVNPKISCTLASFSQRTREHWKKKNKKIFFKKVCKNWYTRSIFKFGKAIEK